MRITHECNCAYCQFDAKLTWAVDTCQRIEVAGRLPVFCDPLELALFMDDIATLSVEQFSDSWH